ncbi:digalactosyldiacylglycerol synthase [Fistulifera solaris]|uniref:Digalactosyldiacylglycerol synthase n=1 Tax=Fistulifera solaris TaxID=1519565 RepID=A0A1Z5JBT6_FISSO|nr:digalactosyldiacylglycerol synthase [Fistulifera solaris]|eukprot:GAX11352.1 digalactosyldiacylglycerol synthase [Fistulifera solaris]
MRILPFLVLCSIYVRVTQCHNTTTDEDEEEEDFKKAKEQFGDPKFQALRKQYWEDTFREIRNLGAMTSESRFFPSQWKLLLEDDIIIDTNNRTKTATRKRRFEGFPSWDRLLQDWADDVQDYLDKAQAESADGYSFGNYGRPMNFSSSETNVTTKTKTSTSFTLTEERVDSSATIAATETKKSRTTSMPIPQPAKPGEAVLPETDLADPSKRILIVTTASLPWKTGTAVNPLLRAAYLTRGRKDFGGSVTLMLPWLERPEDQKRVYGENNAFQTPEDQEANIRTWLRESANMPQESEELIIAWYTAWQNPVENSVYSMGDITSLIPGDSIDICILEEPEHLNWYRAPGESWTKKFKHVVGILHTNYFQYAMDQPAALIRAPAMRLLCSWMCRAHCHRVIKLSGTLDKVAPEKELVENVHGVRATFLDAGVEVSRRLETDDGKQNDPVFGATAEISIYFIGKMLWSKGLGSLMELLRYAEESADLRVSVDMYGGGPDQEAASVKAKKLDLDMPFHGPVDHAELASTHKIFVNPSTSEVLCTTSAEALAMGKFVILPSHPSNDFFAQFPNCLTYTTKEEFVGNLYYALTHAPEPLTEEYSYALSWEAATDRLKAAACIPEEEAHKLSQAIIAEEAEIEISLPPLVEDEKTRKVLATTFANTRRRFRLFRTKLSSEIEQSRVLPRPVRERLLIELNKRLDIDIDEMFDSPKLKVKLSPAELDKSLLELYDKISQSSSGDVLRVIGGGGPVALQNLYMKRQAAKKSRKNLLNGGLVDVLPTFMGEIEGGEKSRTATQRVRWALSRNLPRNNRASQMDDATVAVPDGSRSSSDKKSSGSSLSTSRNSQRNQWQASGWGGLQLASSLSCRPPSRSAKFSILI